eukprot:8107326-Prorocentrum_lima.AAC.1
MAAARRRGRPARGLGGKWHSPQAGRRLQVHRQSAAASTHRTNTRNKGPIRHASALGRPVTVGMVCMPDLRAQGLRAQCGAPRRFQARHGVPASCGDCRCGAPRRGVLM